MQQVKRTYVRAKGRTWSYFGGCDYFRLASHPAVLRAVRAATGRYGLNVSASRLTTGNHTLYGALERTLREFFDAESALVVPTGYLTNLIVAQALARSFSHAVLDERAHLALVDAAALLECPVLRFKHREPEDLRRVVQRCGPRARLILLTDGMYSQDGSVAPLKEYLKILPRDACLLVDDAHGAGVLGQNGKGTLEQEGVTRKRVIQTLTLSKAFGTYGGAVLGPGSLRRRLVERSPIVLGSTPLPLPLVHAAVQALGIVARAKGRLQQTLLRNSAFVKNGLRAAGFDLPDHPGPIVPVRPTSAREGARLKRVLLAAGIFPPYIEYQAERGNGYFRFAISSEHTPGQLRDLVEALRRWAKGVWN